MRIVNYFTCDISVQCVEKFASQISKPVLWAITFLTCRILSMSSVSFKCPGDGRFPHPQVGAGTVGAGIVGARTVGAGIVGAGLAVKRFLISLYSNVKSKSAEATTLPPEMNIKDECSFSVSVIDNKRINNNDRQQKG